MDEIIYSIIANHGDTAAAWTLAGLATLLARYVWARISSEVLRGVLVRLQQEVFAAVAEVWQTYVSELKASRADGKLEEDEKKQALQMALATLRTNLGSKGLARLARVIGATGWLGSLLSRYDETKVDGYLTTQIEGAVNAMKLAGAAAGAKTAGTRAGGPGPGGGGRAPSVPFAA